MKFEHSTYQQPLSMVGLGGGATSLGRGGAAKQNYWPFTADKFTVPTKTPVYNFNSQSSILPTTGFFMKPDGSALFTMQTDNIIRRHSMSTAWDITTASYDQSTSALLSTTLAGLDNETLRGLDFKQDGTKVFFANRDYVYQYDLSTAWDLSTISSSATTTLSVSPPSTKTITSIFLRPDGNQIYVTIAPLTGNYGSTLGPFDGSYQAFYQTSTGDSEVREYYNYSGSTYYWQLNYYSLRNTFSTVIGAPLGISFNTKGGAYGDGGYDMYLTIHDGGNLNVRHYTLSSRWSVGNVTNGGGNNISSMYNFIQYAFGMGLNFTWRIDSANEGEEIYIPAWFGSIYTNIAGSYGSYTNSNGNTAFGVVSYAGAPGWHLIKEDTTYTNIFSPVANNNSSSDTWGGLSENTFWSFTFKPDGTKLYYFVHDYNSYKIKSATLNTAWDLRTVDSTTVSSITPASFVYNSRHQAMQSLMWNSNGTKMLCGPDTGMNYDNSTFTVLNFSTPYDISTYSNTYDYLVLNSSSGWPSTSYIKCGCASPDGYHLYALHHTSSGSGTNTIYQWTCSTAFSPSTAGTSVGNVTIPQNANQIKISPDGTQLIVMCDRTYVSGTNYPIPLEVTSYNLSTAFDITTATRDKTTVLGNLTGMIHQDYRYHNKSEFNIDIVSNGEGAAENGIYIFHLSSMWAFKIEVA